MPQTKLEPVAGAAQLRGHDLYRLVHAGRELLVRVAVNRGEDGLPEDVNRDGRVDLADLSILSGNWNRTGSPAAGDLTGDGRVDLADLAALSAAWGRTHRLPLIVSLPGSDAVNTPNCVTYTSLARQLAENQRRRSWISLAPVLPAYLSPVNCPADWPQTYWPRSVRGTPGAGYEYYASVAAGGWWCDAVCAAADAAIAQFGGDPGRQVVAGFSLGSWAAGALMRHDRQRWAAGVHVAGWFIAGPYPTEAVIDRYADVLEADLQGSAAPLLLGCGEFDEQLRGLRRVHELCERIGRPCRLDVRPTPNKGAYASHVDGYRLWWADDWNDWLFGRRR